MKNTLKRQPSATFATAKMVLGQSEATFAVLPQQKWCWVMLGQHSATFLNLF